jgi:photosystem II stability/assembly factor-like uncharacterized protein
MQLRRPLAAAVTAATLLAGTAVVAAPLGEALSRPAATVRAPARVVLLAAARVGERLVVVGERGVIAVSDDEGSSWRQVPCPTSVTLTALRFSDERHGVAVGHGGVVLATEDGGNRWALRLDGRRAAEVALAAADTPELKRDAQRLVADGPDKPFLDVLMWDAQRWLVAGAYGLAFETRDAGRTWQSWIGRLPNPRALHWYLVRRQGDTLLFAGEQGLLASSADGGATFTTPVSPYRGSWFAGEILADGQWLVAGLRGNAWRSADRGRSWSQIASPAPASITAVLAVGQELLLANQAGMVMRLNGDTLAPVTTAPLPMPSALVRGRDALFAAGIAGIQPVPALAAKDAR